MSTSVEFSIKLKLICLFQNTSDIWHSAYCFSVINQFKLSNCNLILCIVLLMNAESLTSSWDVVVLFVISSCQYYCRVSSNCRWAFCIESKQHQITKTKKWQLLKSSKKSASGGLKWTTSAGSRTLRRLSKTSCASKPKCGSTKTTKT